MKPIVLCILCSLFVTTTATWTNVVHKLPVCQRIMSDNGLSGRFPGAVAHGIHSITLEDLRYYFKPNATEKNYVPTLNYDLSDPHSVLRHAPMAGYDTGFSTIAMRHVDQVLRNIGRKNWYLTNYNTLEQLVHTLHMDEVWTSAKVFYDRLSARKNWNNKKLCDCVTDVDNNGLMKMLPFMSLKIRYPGITSGNVLRLSNGGVADWSGNLYQYHFFNNWSKELTKFNFNDDIEKVLHQASDKLQDGDTGTKHLDSVENWNVWKSGMKEMHEHDSYELAMFLYCTLKR